MELWLPDGNQGRLDEDPRRVSQKSCVWPVWGKEDGAMKKAVTIKGKNGQRENPGDQNNQGTC